MMKKFVCAMLVLTMLLGCALAEGTGTELWAHEAGWTSFSIAISRDGSDEVWEEAAKTFSESMGMNLTGVQLKTMVLQGHSLENGVEELSVEGNRIIGRKADGTELFSHEYAEAELVEDPGIMSGARVHVFHTEEANAGEYTWLLLTEPQQVEKDGASYTTFNLVCTQKDDYHTLFDMENGQNEPVAVCALIEKDVTAEGLALVINNFFSPTAKK